MIFMTGQWANIEKKIKSLIIPGSHQSVSATASVIAFLFFIFFSAVHSVQAQKIDLLLKGGHVIDPKNTIDRDLDVAIAEGKIIEVAPDISTENANKVIDATGYYVVPGLIDLHTHVFVGSNDGFADGFSSVSPDDITLKAGITTVADAGTSGWKNFPVFKEQVIDRSKTRVLSFLNIAGSGTLESPIRKELSPLIENGAVTIHGYLPEEKMSDICGGHPMYLLCRILSLFPMSAGLCWRLDVMTMGLLLKIRC